MDRRRQTRRSMKAALLSAGAALAAAAPSASAFAPPSSPPHRRPKSRSLALNSAIAATPSLPNPYGSLPWVTEREERRRQRRLEVENAALFRELGLPEDATYEDVASKTGLLIAQSEALPKNEGIKRKIKIEIARDKIYQIRLNERIAGVRTEQEDAAMVQKWEEEGVDGLVALTESVDDIVKPKKKLRIPVVSGLIEYAQSIYTPPDAVWRKRCLIIWGVSTLVCLFNPTLTEGCARCNWLPAGGMMGYRGMPVEKGEGGFNPYRGRRNKKHQVKAMGIGLAAWVFAKGLAKEVVAKVPALATSNNAEWFRFAIVQGLLGMLVAYVQTYKEGEEGKDLMI